MKRNDQNRSGELSGNHLIFARLVWIAFALTFVCLQIVSQAAAYHAAQIINLTVAQIQELKAMGLSFEFYATYRFLLGLPIPLLWGVMGLLIFWRKSNDKGALIISALVVGLGTASSIPTWQAFARTYPDLLWVIPIVAFISNVCLYSFFFVFPSGRYLPRWTVGLALALSLFNILNSYEFALSPSLLWMSSSLEWLFPLFLIVSLGSFILAPIYRYRSISTPIEREQIKWVIFTIVVGVILFAAVASTAMFLPNSLPDENISFITVFVQPIGWMLPFSLIPIAIAASILRYRLFDIDLIIRRTLVYGGMTATLALIYFGGVVLLQGILSAITGESRSEIVTVATTLVIAALFTPLRKRIQHDIDRRFYRKKYNAEKALAKFSVTARSETDMAALMEMLNAIVMETLQPETFAIWIRPVKDERP